MDSKQSSLGALFLMKALQMCACLLRNAYLHFYQGLFSIASALTPPSSPHVIPFVS
jgi:hypothetical protein